jgi:hypothetical protein
MGTSAVTTVYFQTVMTALVSCENSAPSFPSVIHGRNGFLPQNSAIHTESTEKTDKGYYASIS